MTTKYFLRRDVAIDCEGRNYLWSSDKTYVDTLEEAKRMGEKIKLDWCTRNWQVIEKTIDEDTFFVDEKMVYDNYKETGKSG